MAWWWPKPKPKAPPENSPVLAHTNPALDLEALGPVVRHNHVAYVPSRPWSRVPGVGTGNLIYAPDFLLSAPAWFAGNTRLRRANAIKVAQPPVIITRPKTVVEGIGGITAGQIVHQPLLSVDLDVNGSTEVGG